MTKGYYNPVVIDVPNFPTYQLSENGTIYKQLKTKRIALHPDKNEAVNLVRADGKRCRIKVGTIMKATEAGLDPSSAEARDLVKVTKANMTKSLLSRTEEATKDNTLEKYWGLVDEVTVYLSRRLKEQDEKGKPLPMHEDVGLLAYSIATDVVLFFKLANKVLKESDTIIETNVKGGEVTRKNPTIESYQAQSKIVKEDLKQLGLDFSKVVLDLRPTANKQLDLFDGFTPYEDVTKELTSADGLI